LPLRQTDRLAGEIKKRMSGFPVANPDGFRIKIASLIWLRSSMLFFGDKAQEFDALAPEQHPVYRNKA